MPYNLKTSILHTFPSMYNLFDSNLINYPHTYYIKMHFTICLCISGKVDGWVMGTGTTAYLFYLSV